jgi:small-conductance mechanosensitive channel
MYFQFLINMKVFASRLKLVFLLSILFILSIQTGFAQNIDSASAFSEAKLMRAIDSVKRADSIKRIGLLREIDKLKGSERQRRNLLVKLKEVEREDSLHAARLQEQLTGLRTDSIGFPVAPFIDTLFVIHTRIGSFTAHERAEAIADRIDRLYSNFQFAPDSLKVMVNESSADIVFRDQVILTINELEAEWYHLSPELLAKDYAMRISKAIQIHREQNKLSNIAIRIGEATLIILAILLIVWLINGLHNRMKKRLFKVKDKMLDGFRIQGQKVLDRHGELQVLLFLIRFVKILLIIVSVYFALQLMFSLFPGTERMAQTMWSWILEPLSKLYEHTLAFLPNLFTITVILVVVHYFIALLKFFSKEVARGSITIPGFYADWAKPTFALVRILLIAFTFILIFPYLPGSHSPIFRGVSVFFGLLFSFGSTSAIANIIAGIVITYMRPFKLGDRIKIGEVIGDVIEKSMLVTRLRTPKNEEITIPNSSVLSGHTLNYTSSARDLGLILYTSVTIGYDAPWKKVHALLIEAALATDGISKKE